MSHRSAMLALAIFTLLASPTLLFGQGVPPADLAGTWAVDKDAFRAEMQRVMEVELKDMSPEELAEVGPSMEAIVESVVSRFDQTVEFHGDGVALINGNDGERTTGRWTRQGDRIRLEPEGDTSLAGPLDGGTLRLTAEGDTKFELVLKRR